MARLSGYAWGEVGRIVLLVHWQLSKISCDNTTRLPSQRQDQMCPIFSLMFHKYLVKTHVNLNKNFHSERISPQFTFSGAT